MTENAEEQNEFDRREMVEPIERMFEREYPHDFGIFQPILEKETEGGKGNIDMVYVAGDRRELHVIRLEQNYDNCLFDTRRGLHTIGEVEANYVWLALPLYDFQEGEELFNDIMLKTCEERGIGIISAQHRGRGVSAKVILKAKRRKGDFLEKYGDIAERLRTSFGDDTLAEEGFRVVPYS